VLFDPPIELTSRHPCGHLNRDRRINFSPVCLAVPVRIDDKLQQHAAADRREVDPPIQGKTATWASAGQLDRWVKERQQWSNG
jgi:hypothetical protein